jgi:hypothetical protein
MVPGPTITSSTVANPNPVPCPVTPPNINVTIPDEVIMTAASRLCCLSISDKTIANSMLTTQHLAMLRPDQRAALNCESMEVPCWVDGSDNPTSDPIRLVQYLDSNQQPKFKASKQSNNRWYSLPRGVNFTGVVRGFDVFNELISGVKQPLGHGCKDRASAEYSWLKYYYDGRCARVWWDEKKVYHVDEVRPSIL